MPGVMGAFWPVLAAAHGSKVADGVVEGVAVEVGVMSMGFSATLRNAVFVAAVATVLEVRDG